ncbi:hypothetical protein ABT390_28615 [Streptomyces aurantiacus]|uniref:Integral membrane protein n=1 Tax=Streptomyces aurantiacus JA 4570 TaxID=1286094 RepID=S3ZM48_9ACTN|nr:hypothetical protein [Streptomyces aurantiacus]EPH39380.1 hypothetical protein STRAU_7540 [Streptomyces aurantiacus JA 4570]
MHGHGYAPPHPPAPSEGSSQVTLRVLFVVLAVVTCGFLAWAAMLRLALVTRRTLDWALFTIVAGLEAAAVVLIGIDPGDGEFSGPGNAGMTILVSTVVPVIAYYLTMDIRHFARARAHVAYQQPQFPGYVPQQPQPHQPHQPSYGYPSPTPPPHVTHTPVPQAPPAAPAAPTPPPPSRPAPARIDQVRAELDELSDYLRKQEGGS